MDQPLWFDPNSWTRYWTCVTVKWPTSHITTEIISYTYWFISLLIYFLQIGKCVDVFGDKLEQQILSPSIFMILLMCCVTAKSLFQSESELCFEHSTVLLWLSPIDSLSTVSHQSEGSFVQFFDFSYWNHIYVTVGAPSYCLAWLESLFLCHVCSLQCLFVLPSTVWKNTKLSPSNETY